MTTRPPSVRLVDHDSPEYRATVALRVTILRSPQGLSFSEAELRGEAGQVHIAIFEDEGTQCAACVVLCQPATAGSDSLLKWAKMRQMAVAEHRRAMGLGRALAVFCEDHARKLGADMIFCHARHYAVPFYDKLGYRAVGDPFTEVSMTHLRMEKPISP